MVAGCNPFWKKLLQLITEYKLVEGTRTFETSQSLRHQLNNNKFYLLLLYENDWINKRKYLMLQKLVTERGGWQQFSPTDRFLYCATCLHLSLGIFYLRLSRLETCI